VAVFKENENPRIRDQKEDFILWSIVFNYCKQLADLLKDLVVWTQKIAD
jgi:hypothetical protein